LSRVKDFDAKFWDVIGLYLNPPDSSAPAPSTSCPQLRALA
jgi:hypothetical protein